MLEILDESADWEIPLPYTWQDPNRHLEARQGDEVHLRWEFDPYTDDDFTPWHVTHESVDALLALEGRRIRYSYPAIVAVCLHRQWRLYSTPTPETPRGTHP